MKKILAIVLLLALVLSSLPVDAAGPFPTRRKLTIKRKGYRQPPNYHTKKVLPVTREFNPNKYDKETRGWVQSFPIYKEVPRRGKQR